ncbi:hypothetical protein MJ560_22125 [Klebsiella pneumoniae]|nr:hypothetical protein MJ560_22125 [Klebsiella pneumoniae]
MIALLLIACPLLPLLADDLSLKAIAWRQRSRGAAWVCGYDHEQSIVVTAHGFAAMPVKEAFAPLLKLRHWLNPVRSGAGLAIGLGAGAGGAGSRWLSWRCWW